MASSQPLAARQRAAGEGPRARARHQAVAVGFDELVEGTRAGRGQQAPTAPAPSACSGATEPSGTMNRPPSAVAMMSTLMRSLKTPSTVRQRATAGAWVRAAEASRGQDGRLGAAVHGVSPGGSVLLESGAGKQTAAAQLRPHKVERYFQLMK
ncbi:MAG: hypothetical protein V9G29_15875 [Burkholderiaceae bacterium]